jgi:hypothetical protein
MTGGAPVAVHPDAVVLEFLLGTWSGEGQGYYSTVASFAYGEETRFWHVGKPFVAYSQRTWALDDGRPLHSEAGYWRPKPDGVLEVVVSHPSGHVEVAEGTVAGTVVTLQSRLVGATSTAKQVTAIHRHVEVSGDVLTYTMAMEAVGESLQEHLRAVLHRTG